MVNLMLERDTFDNLRRRQQLFLIIFFHFFITLTISGCGEADYSSTEKNNGETGGIAFNVVWEGAPTKEDSQTISRALDCSAAGVDSVTFEVYNGESLLLPSKSFDCAIGDGTIDGVPAGSNRKLAVSGKNSSGTVIYYGERIGITVTAGQDTPVGVIVCAQIDCSDMDTDDYYAEINCGTLVDCNDNDDTIYPGATEICGDSIDQDCDGVDLACSLDNTLPENGLVAFWPFNGDANDESGNGNSGTVEGPTLVEDRLGNPNSAYSFDGIDDYINIGNNVKPPFPVTVCAWIKTNASDAGQIIFRNDRVDSSSYRNGLMVWIAGDATVAAGVYSGYSSGSTRASVYTAEPVITENQWHFLTFILISYNNMEIYNNGVKLETVLGTGTGTSMTYSSADGVMGFSKGWDGNVNFLNGTLDDVMVYNRILTEPEIQAIYTVNISNLTCTDADDDNHFAEIGCGTLSDCNDKDDNIYPGATEICGDGIDQDCNGSDLECVNGLPTVTISSPVNANNYSEWYNIVFSGSADDPEDGELTGISLVWTSDTDGQIGTGAEITSDTLTLGSHAITLTATDSNNETGSASVSITIEENNIPVANAGNSTVVTAGSVVTPNGSASSDADMDPITYVWSFISIPDGSTATLSDATLSTPSFTADLEGAYTLQLVVNDGRMDSDPAFVTITAIAEATVLFSENFENGLGLWNADNGIWEVGEPTSGPGSAFNDLSVAATILAGEYTNVDSRFISPSILIPSISAAEEIHLRFWHWFQFATYDAGSVQIIEELSPGVWSDWATLETEISSCGSVWTYQRIDLSAFAGKKIKIGFLMDNGSSSYTSNGWYIDDILISTEDVYSIDVSVDYFEDFEQGIGSWKVDNGVWEIGVPSSGPDEAYAGTNSAGTVLAGNYVNVDANLLSPTIIVPPISASEIVYLRFWNWFNAATYDACSVGIREQLSPGVWENIVTLETYTANSGGIWSYPLIDISAYADKRIQIVFLLDNGSSSYTSSGWYIDDISIQILQQ